MERMSQETYEQSLCELMYNYYLNLEVSNCYCYGVVDRVDIVFSDWFEDPLFPNKTELSLFRLTHGEIMCVINYQDMTRLPTVFTLY